MCFARNDLTPVARSGLVRDKTEVEGGGGGGGAPAAPGTAGATAAGTAAGVAAAEVRPAEDVGGGAGVCVEAAAVGVWTTGGIGPGVPTTASTAIEVFAGVVAEVVAPPSFVAV